MMPPKTLSPAQLWAALTEMPRPTRLVPYPRTREDGEPVGRVLLCPLTSEETIRAGIAAELLVRERLPGAKAEESIGYREALSAVSAVEQLFLACRDPDNPEQPAFPSSAAMRRCMTTDEVSALYSAYLTVCAEIGPIVGAMTRDEMDAWVAKLIEGGKVAAHALSFFTSEGRSQLILHLVDRLRRSATEPDSVGSPRAGTDGPGTDALPPNDPDTLGDDDE